MGTLLTTAGGLVELGGIAWDPGLRGLLSVLLGFFILGGSVYLILATNTGARLGMLLALAGLSGWLVVLTLYWTIQPPGIGPSGPLPSWTPLEIHYSTPGEQPVTEVVRDLPPPEDFAEARDAILAANPEVADRLPSGASLSDVAAEDATLVADVETGGWRIVPAAEAGEMQAAADVVLAEEGVFKDTSEFKKLTTFEIGGKPRRTDDSTMGRVVYKVETTVWWRHPPRYAAVQVQPVIPQEAKPGEAPPTPVADETQPVITVIMVRDLGNQRGLPALYFIVSLSFFIIFVLMLHYRDKTFDRHVNGAEKAG